MNTNTATTMRLDAATIDALLAIDAISVATHTMSKQPTMTAAVIRAYMDVVRNKLQVLEGCAVEMSGR